MSRHTVSVAGSGMEPAPVGVEGDRRGLCHAATALGALLRSELGVVLRGGRAGLLSIDARGREERRSEESGGVVHD
jgi:hypothetical protein